MDAPLVAAPTARTWEYLGELARLARQITPETSTQALVTTIVESAQLAQFAACGGLAITDPFGQSVAASWGVGQEELHILRDQSPDGMTLLVLSYQGQPVGELVIGWGNDGRDPGVSGFLAALRQHLDLLLELTWRTPPSTTPAANQPLVLAQLQAGTQALSRAQKSEDLLEALLQNIRTLLPGNAVKLCLYHPLSETLAVARSYGLRQRSDQARIYRMQDGLTGWVAQNRQLLHLDDFSKAPVRPGVTTLQGGRPITQYIGLPLQTSERLLGTIEVFRSDKTPFPATAEQILSILAAQAAQSLESMQRHEQANEYLFNRLHQLRALQRISRELTATLYLHNILGFALDETLKATHASSGYIALRGYEARPEKLDLPHEEALGVTPTPQIYITLRELEDDQSVRVITAAGYSSDELERLLNQPLPHQTTVAEQAITSGESQVIDQVHADDRPYGIGPASVAALAVPIYYEAQVIGVINLHSQSPFAFDRDALDFVGAVADQVALAIGNDQRWIEQRRQRDLLQQRANTLNQVLKIGQALRADRSLDELLEQIAFSVVETTGFRAVAFYITEPETTQLTLVSGAGIPLTEIERLRTTRFDMAMLEQLLDQQYMIGRSYYVPDAVMRVVAPGLNLIDGNPGETADSWQDNDMLLVPLRSTQGQLLGIFAIDEPYDHQRPTRRAVEPLEIFADQAAIAIENTALLREARDQTEQITALYRASTSAAETFDLELLLERTYQEVESYLGMPTYMYVATYAPKDETIHFEMFKHEGQPYVQFQHMTMPKQGWTGYVIDTGNILHIRDALQENNGAITPPILLDDPIRSYVGIPIRNSDTVLGVLSIQSPEPHAYNSQDVQFLATLANQVAIALDKLRLFQERDQRITELNIMNRIARITSTTLDLEQMMTQIYDCLAAYLTIDAFFLMVYQADTNRIESALTVDSGIQQFSMRGHPPAAGSLTDWIIRHHQPLHFQNIQTEELADGIDPTPFGNEEQFSKAWLGLPLLAGERVVGVISVQSYTAGVYGDREYQFMLTVANQVALGVQNALLFNQTQGQLRQLALVNKVSAAAAATLEFEHVFQASLDAMVEASHADQARLVLYDRVEGTANLMAQYSRYASAQHGHVTLAEQPMVAWLDQHRQPYIAQDAQHDALLEWWADSFREHDIQSVLIVPLITGEEVLGVVRLDYLGHQHQLDEREIELSLTIANQAAVALEKARLFEATQRGSEQLRTKVGELSALLEAARVLSSSLKPQEVLDSLMDVVRRQLQVSTVALWQYTIDGMLVPAAMLGIPASIARTLQVPSGQGLTGRVASQAVPLVVGDVEAEGGSLYPDFNRENNYTSFMGVPVRYRDRTIGVLSVMTITRRDFSNDEVQLLAGMADQAAIALENARLFSEREARIGELTTLNRLSQAVSATLDLPEILRALHQGIGEILDITISFIGLYDRTTRHLTFPVARDRGVDYEDTDILLVERADTLAARLILERRPILLHSIEDVEAFEPTLPEEGLPRIASYLGVPILLGSNVLGMITVQSEEPNRFTTDDLRFLETVASQAATAIANARLFQERERRLREVSVLQEMGTAITATLDLQTVLERLHAQIGRVLEVSSSTMILYEAAHNQVTYAIAYDQGKRVEIPVGPPEGTSGWVIRNRAPVLAHTADEFRRDDLRTPVPGDEKLKQSCLTVPILAGETVLGVIDIQSYRPHAYNRDDLRFMVTVASQASVAITNARLFQERGRRIEELATFNQIGQELSGVVNQHELLDMIYRQTSRLIDTSNFYIALYDQRFDEIGLPLVIEDGHRITMTGRFKLANTLTRHVIKTRNSLLVGIHNEAQLAQHGIEYNTEDLNGQIKSWLGVPMIAADKVVGVIGVQNTERENAYSQDDVRLLETIGAWGSTALENARLLGETRQSVQELTALYEVSMALAGSLDPSDIQHTAGASVLDLLTADLCMISAMDQRRRQLPPAWLSRNDRLTNTAAILDLIVPLSADLPMSEPLVLDDLSTANPALAEASGMATLLGTAIISREQQIGTIWVGWEASHVRQDRELSLLAILTNQLSQALTRAQLLLIEQERRRVADTLRETAQMFTRLRTVDQIHQLIFDQLGRVLVYDTATVLMREGHMAHVVSGRGFPVGSDVTVLAFNIDTDSNLRNVIETRHPMVLEDARKSPYFVLVPETEHVRGWIAAPLLVDDEVIGLLCVDSRIPGSYSDDDAAIVFALASQAAQAIRNARLYEEVTTLNAELEQRVVERTAQLQEEQDRLRAVHTITLELSATLELEPTLNKALALAADAVDAQRGSIMLLNAETNELTCRAVINSAGDVETTSIPISFEHGDGLAAWVLRTREAICVPDVLVDSRWLQEEGRADEVRSVIAAPLITQDGTLGLLMLSSPHMAYFQDPQVQLLTTIANEVAVVVHNATLYQVITELATERGNAEQQQREENSKNQAVLQSLGEGVIVLDENQQIMLFNAAAEQILGIAANTVTGQPLQSIRLQSTEQEAERRTAQIYEGLQLGLRALHEQTRNHNRMLTVSAPEQTIALNFAQWLGPRNALFGSVVVLRDVTREIESDRAKREFISSVSHELRTPLTSIKGYVDLLLLGAAGQMNESQLSFLSVVKNNANRLMDLINDILEIGRIDSERIQLIFEEVNIRNIFGDVLQTLQVQIDRKQMTVLVDVDDLVPDITADIRRLTQVVLNLVSNAVKYTFPNGRVMLRSFINRSGMLQVDIEDTGVGISIEDQKNLFRRFQRFDNPLRDEAGGTGLGLSIAKSLVELHGGEMWVTSEPGKGSIFRFMIPVDQPEAGLPTTPEQVAS